MIQNITVNNLTGREIPFDLVRLMSRNGIPYASFHY